jgi:2-(1,2-epoxy-1,2-dihydrophenyl)acetyl-CoA isomerase
MTRETVLLDYVDGKNIAIVRLNRPAALNALNPQLAEDFVSVVNELQAEPELRAVIITGNGKAFSAGGDLGAFKAAADAGQFLQDLAGEFHAGIATLRNIAAPFIAAINGPCFGVGLSLACACDLRIAVESASFSVAFTGVGLSPDSGLPYFLPKIVGLGMATELAFLNPVIDAKRAKEIDLVNVVTSQDVVEEALAMARKLAAMPTQALGLVKRLYNASYTLDLKQHLDLQVECLGKAASTEDFREGCAAFLERRKPDYKGC